MRRIAAVLLGAAALAGLTITPATAAAVPDPTALARCVVADATNIAHPTTIPGQVLGCLR